MYHVMSRGNRREKIFLDDVDRQDFLKTLAEACQKTDWQVSLGTELGRISVAPNPAPQENSPHPLCLHLFAPVQFRGSSSRDASGTDIGSTVPAGKKKFSRL